MTRVGGLPDSRRRVRCATLFTAHAARRDPDALLEHVDTSRWPACSWTRPSSSSRSRWMTCSGSRSWTTSRCWPTASAPISGPAPSPVRRRLLEVAHSLEELKTICRCGARPSSTRAGSATQWSSTATRSPSTAGRLVRVALRRLLPRGLRRPAGQLAPARPRRAGCTVYCTGACARLGSEHDPREHQNPRRRNDRAFQHGRRARLGGFGHRRRAGLDGDGRRLHAFRAEAQRVAGPAGAHLQPARPRLVLPAAGATPWTWTSTTSTPS